MTQLQEQTLIRIVDDEALVRNALAFMLGCSGWKTVSYDSAEAYLADLRSDVPGCLLLDIRMPGMSGVELQRTMKTKDIRLPIIFITGHADVETAVLTLRAGAFDFLQKPVDSERLNSSLESACAISVEQTKGAPSASEVQAVWTDMSPREKEILKLLADGLTNQDIAERLHLSARTIQGHRNNLYHKLKVHNLRQLTERLKEADLSAL